MGKKKLKQILKKIKVKKAIRIGKLPKKYLKNKKKLKLRKINYLIKNKKGGDVICARPSEIVEARFSLTKRQNDLIDMVLANIADDNNHFYDIDLGKYLGIQEKDYVKGYQEFRRLVDSFNNTCFYIKSVRTAFNWFSSIEYRGNNIIRVEISQRLKEILLEAKRGVYYHIENSLRLEGKYAQRMYYFLRQYKDTGIFIIKVEELMNSLNCPSSYRYVELKKHVLEESLVQINNKTDIKFEYEPIKVARKVEAIKFKIENVDKTVVRTISESKVPSKKKNMKKKTKELTEEEILIENTLIELKNHGLRIAKATLTRLVSNNGPIIYKQAVNILLTNIESGKKIKNCGPYLTKIIDNIVNANTLQEVAVAKTKDPKQLKVNNFKGRSEEVKNGYGAIIEAASNNDFDVVDEILTQLNLNI